MPEQELDLLQVGAGFAAELRAGTAEVVGAEALDPDLPGRGGDDGSDRPVTEALPDLAALSDGTQQRSFFDDSRGLPNVDSLLDTHGDDHGADAAAFAAKVGDDPAVLAQLNVCNGERGKFPSPQGAADQEGKNGVVALPLRGGPVGDGQQLAACSLVSQSPAGSPAAGRSGLR